LLIHADRRARAAEQRWLSERLDEKRTATVEAENRRLTEFMGLARWPHFTAAPARVWARNSTDWFHSVIVRPAEGAPCRTGDAAVSVVDGRVVILGQVAEILPQGLARVLLLTDPSSAVSAHAARTGEQGLVEGRGANVLLLNYLFSDSEVKPGDEVVTSGLGEVFPEGLLVGQVLSIQDATHESFKRAVVSPAARLSNIQHLLLLSRRPEPGELP
jgi:rod shape-determining protein MreC